MKSETFYSKHILNGRKRNLVFTFVIISILTTISSVMNQTILAQGTSQPKILSPQDLIARDNYFDERCAGGPGILIPEDAYFKALLQKALLPKDNNLKNSPTSAISWVTVNPIGMFYARTGNNYVSGRTNSIAFHPSNPNIFYIAAAQGGVWKTTDGGINWIALTDTLPTLSSGDIEVDQSNPNILYYGTGELNYSGDSHYGNGIYKSTDAGLSWNQIVGMSIGWYVSKIVIDPSNSNILYVAGNGACSKSTNGGLNWNSLAPTNCTSLLIDPTNTQVLYAASGGTGGTTILKTTDGGMNWTTAVNGLASGRARISLAMSDVNHLTLYASIASSSTQGLLGLYRTTDGANSWTLQASSPNYLGGQGWYDNACCVKTGDPNTVVGAGLDLYLSTDGGVTLVQKSSWWTTNSDNFTHADIHYITYHGSVLYCLSDGGVYKSTDDGNTWTDLNHHLSTLLYQSADYDSKTILNLYGGTQDNDKETSTNGGNDWIQRTTGDGGYTVVDPVNTNYVYGQYVGGSLERSANYGISYVEVRPSGSSGGLFYNPYEMAPGNHNTIVFGRADVWKTNKAQTCTQSRGWTQIATTAVVGGNVSAIGISATNTNKIYIGTSNGKILVTTNNGNNWSLQQNFPYVTDFAVDKTNDDICYVSFAGYGGSRKVFKTTDGGSNWNDITNGLPYISANSLILRTASPRMLFVGTDLGVFQTTDEGTTWVSFNSGLPTMQVYDLKYKESSGIILAATHGRGCWTFNLAQVIGINPNSQNIITKYELNQNYPNPFNPTTKISFSLPEAAMVKLYIFDILGREVAKLVNGNFNPGKHELTWNASAFSSGVYFYKLTAGDYTSTKKLILLK